MKTFQTIRVHTEQDVLFNVQDPLVYPKEEGGYEETEKETEGVSDRNREWKDTHCQHNL